MARKPSSIAGRYQVFRDGVACTDEVYLSPGDILRFQPPGFAEPESCADRLLAAQSKAGNLSNRVDELEAALRQAADAHNIDEVLGIAHRQGVFDVERFR